jgi:hypothetical protein
MHTTDNILFQAVAAPYYRRNAGFFLFLFFLLFGLYPSFKQSLEFHYAVINGIGNSVQFFLLAFAIWLLYTIKTIHFVHGCIKNKAYNFLQLLNALPSRKRFFHLLQLQCLLLLPALCYGLAAFIIALVNNHPAGAAAIFITLTALCFLSTGAVFAFLSNKHSSASGGFLPVMPFRFKTGLFSVLLKFIFNQQFFLLLLLKTATFSCLYFFAKIDEQVFEDRILWLLYITSLIGHCILIYRNHHFMEIRLSFYRNMPVKPLVTLLSLLGVYAVVLIPEIWALKGVAIQQHAIGNFIWMALTGPSLLLLLHCLLYTEDMKMEGFLKLLFGIWIVTLFFSLSSNRWLLPVICTGMAGFIFFNSYYSYEKNTEVEGLE